MTYSFTGFFSAPGCGGQTRLPSGHGVLRRHGVGSAASPAPARGSNAVSFLHVYRERDCLCSSAVLCLARQRWWWRCHRFGGAVGAELSAAAPVCSVCCLRCVFLPTSGHSHGNPGELNFCCSGRSCRFSRSAAAADDRNAPDGDRSVPEGGERAARLLCLCQEERLSC